jgi:hypothetical protein
MAAYIDVLLALGLAIAKTCTVEEVAVISKRVLIALARVELSLSTNAMDMKLHSILHMSKRILDAGPLCNVSMWRYESMWKKILGMRGNNRHPERTMVNIFAYMEMSMLYYTSHKDTFSSACHRSLVQSEPNAPNREHDYYHRHRMALGEYDIVTSNPGKQNKIPMDEHVLHQLHQSRLSFEREYQDLWMAYMPDLWNTW